MSDSGFVDRIETWNSGGNVMLDIIHLKSGKVLVISDEVVCKYNRIADFFDDEGDHDYKNNTIELIEGNNFI
jgi:hypothetical protein